MGQTLQAASMSIVPASDITDGTYLGIVGADTIAIAQTPVISAGVVYAAGDAVGGLLTFAGAARATGGGGVAEVIIIDRDRELAPLDLVLFDRTFTATADNVPFDPSDADLANCVGVIDIEATDYVSFVDNSVAVDGGLFYVANGTSLFGQLVARGTPTYTAVGDLTVKLTCLRY